MAALQAANTTIFSPFTNKLDYITDTSAAGNVTGTSVTINTVTNCNLQVGGGALTTDATGQIYCSPDDTASAGSGDITDVNEGFSIDVTNSTGPAPTVAFDQTEFTGSRTWGDASTDTIIWTWDRATGIDPTITMGNQTITGQIVAASTGFEVNGERVTDWTGSGISLVGGALTASSGSGDLTDVLAGTGIAVTNGTGPQPSVAFDYSQAIVSGNNYALSAGNTIFGDNGLIFEEATADTLEGFLVPAAITGSDKTWTLPNQSGTIIVSGHTLTGDVTATLGVGGTTALTIAADAVALTTDTTGNYVQSLATANALTGGAAGSEGAVLSLDLTTSPVSAATVVGTGRTFTGGVGIAALGDLSADRTVTFDATEISSLTWGAGAFTTMTFDAGATDPVLTMGNGSVQIAPGGSDLTVTDDVNLAEASPHLEFRDTTDNVAFMWHLDTAEAYRGLTLWEGTDSGSGFAIQGYPFLQFNDSTNALLLPRLKYATGGGELILQTTSQVTTVSLRKCAGITNLAATNDNMSMFSWPMAVTVRGIGCQCSGTCTTMGAFALEDNAGNAMTHATPTCATTGTMTFTSVTANNSLTINETLRFDTTNTPSPTTDTYLICADATPD